MHCRVKKEEKKKKGKCRVSKELCGSWTHPRLVSLQEISREDAQALGVTDGALSVLRRTVAEQSPKQPGGAAVTSAVASLIQGKQKNYRSRADASEVKCRP